MAQVALVTGADRGLGRGIAQVLCERGWTVLAGRNMTWPELDELAHRFPQNLHLLPLDVASDESVQTAAKVAAAIVPGIDLLVSNAAINRSAHIDNVRNDLDFDDIQNELNVNAVGGLRVAKAFLPLLAQGSLKRMCFVSSEAGSIGESTRTGWFGYCMSKAALNMAVRNLSNDLMREGYSFRLYHPGWLRTYMQGRKNLEAHYEPEEAAAIALRWFLEEDAPAELVLRDWEGRILTW